MEWEPEAVKELEKIPEHVRRMAKMGIESSVEKKDKKVVTLADVKEAAQRFSALMETAGSFEVSIKSSVSAPMMPSRPA